MRIVRANGLEVVFIISWKLRATPQMRKNDLCQELAETPVACGPCPFQFACALLQIFMAFDHRH